MAVHDVLRILLLLLPLDDGLRDVRLRPCMIKLPLRGALALLASNRGGSLANRRPTARRRLLLLPRG